MENLFGLTMLPLYLHESISHITARKHLVSTTDVGCPRIRVHIILQTFKTYTLVG